MDNRSKHRKKEIFAVICESHPLVTRYLRPILGRAHDISAHFIAPFRVTEISNRACIFLIDADSITTCLSRYLRNLRSNFPASKSIVLGGSSSDDDLCRLVFIGAAGFVRYDHIETRLIPAIRTVAQGHLVFPPTIFERLAEQASKLSDIRVGRWLFSSREQVALNLLQAGMSNKEIGVSLGISERTVKFHLSNIFSKIGVHDRSKVAELMRSGDFVKQLEAPPIAALAHSHVFPTHTVSVTPQTRSEKHSVGGL